ncbi:MAG: DUF4272 domain-containing protein [Spirochaetes bacterium]|nr:DUF4272 domain-containing protein [Spirochaetota bacterium]
MNVSLYTYIGDFTRVGQALKKHFSAVAKDVGASSASDIGEDFWIQLQDDTKIEFHIVTDQKYVAQQMAGMANYFAKIPCENKELHGKVLRQIEVFNCIVGIPFDETDDDNRTNDIINIILDVAKDINALVLMPNMSLYNYDGELVLSLEGESDLESYTPIGNADVLDKGKTESPADTARRERSLEILKSKNIPHLPQLLSAVMEADTKVRSPAEIAERLFPIFTVSVYCEGRSGGDSWEEAQKYLQAGNDILGGRLDGLLSPAEKEFLIVKEPAQQDVANFSWRYECCYVLMWALGIFEELSFPDNICDVSAMAKILWNAGSLEKFLKTAKPRSPAEILDAADLALRHNWACVDARINGQESPGGLDSGVVQERHYVFNWLIGANGGADWDDVQTHT